MVTAVSTSIGAQKGLLIRNRAAFENARNIDTVIFDKTGTLTEGQFGVTDVMGNEISEDELLELAYALESQSEHPIAKGIVREGRRRNLELKEVTGFENLTGKGLMGIIGGRHIMVVSPGYLRSEGLSFHEREYEALAEEGKTVVFVLEGNKLLGYIALSDIVRDTAKEAINTLRKMNIVNILKLSRATYQKMIQNLIWATGYNAVALPLAAGVLYQQGIVISPALGAVFMSVSTIVAAINARLLKIDKK